MAEQVEPVTRRVALKIIKLGMDTREVIARFEQAMTHYRSGQWASAVESFRALHRDFPEDGPCQTFVERCAALASNPPEGVWDGVYAMTAK